MLTGTVVLVIFPLGAVGQTLPPAGGTSISPAGGKSLGITNPLRADTFTDLFVSIANWVASIVATLAVLMVVVGGFQYMISGGNEEKTKQARQTIQWALIGLGVVLLSWSLLKTLLIILGVE